MKGSCMSDIAKRNTLVPPLPEGYPERVPEFATEEEERDFWDTHDSAPYFYEGEDVTHALRSARQSSETPAFPRMLSRSGSKQARISGRSKKISASRGVNCKRR